MRPRSLKVTNGVQTFMFCTYRRWWSCPLWNWIVYQRILKWRGIRNDHWQTTCHVQGLYRSVLDFQIHLYSWWVILCGFCIALLSFHDLYTRSCLNRVAFCYLKGENKLGLQVFRMCCSAFNKSTNIKYIIYWQPVNCRLRWKSKHQ